MALSTASKSMPFWNAGGSQRAMIDEPVTRCFQPAILPSFRLAAMMSR